MPVGFKYFVDGLFDGSLGFGGEESAGASFLRRDGTVWSTDKDGIAAALLSAEITARVGRTPDLLCRDLERDFGASISDRVAGLLVSWSGEVQEYTPQQARRLLLSEVAIEIANANVRKGLGARLNEILKSNTEKTKELVYAELMAAGLHLPVLPGRTFLLEDARIGPRVLECMASLSPSDPSLYGIVLISRRSLSEPPRAAPRSCPELSLTPPTS